MLLAPIPNPSSQAPQLRGRYQPKRVPPSVVMHALGNQTRDTTESIQLAVHHVRSRKRAWAQHHQPGDRISRQHWRDRGAHATKQSRGERRAILEVGESQIGQAVGMRWKPASKCSVSNRHFCVILDPMDGSLHACLQSSLSPESASKFTYKLRKKTHQQKNSPPSHEVHSSIDRFLVVFHSPTGMAETGLLACRSEKTGRASWCNANTVDFLRSGLTMKTSELAGISRDLRGTASGFLCTSDCVAERKGFELSVHSRTL